MTTKATNKLIKEEMANIKSLPIIEHLSKVEELQKHYNISSEQYNHKQDMIKVQKERTKRRKL